MLYGLGSRRIDVAALQRSRQAIASGERLTADARLEGRVHDMARIQSLREEAAGKGARAVDDVRFSAQPRTPDALLAHARTLARAADRLERAAEAGNRSSASFTRRRTPVRATTT